MAEAVANYIQDLNQRKRAHALWLVAAEHVAVPVALDTEAVMEFAS